MACRPRTPLDVLAATLDRPEQIRLEARKLGVVRRQGKLDPAALLAVVVLGIGMRGSVAIAQLGQMLGEVTGVRLARSSFWDRFTPAFAKLVGWLLDEHVAQARKNVPRPPGALSAFRDVLAVDATVVTLHDALAPVWRGTRSNAQAALKVHAWVRALTGELVKYRVTAESHADCRAFGIDAGLRGCLVLFDKAYSSPSLWQRIESVGGYFLTRLPKDRSPEIVSLNRKHRGRSRKAIGRSLREVLPGLQRAWLDVDAKFRVRVRGYDGRKGHWKDATFRLVAVRDRRTGTYEVFVTNAPPSMLPAEWIAATYRLRWEVETFFRTSKSGSGLDELPTQKAEIVRALVYASLLRATASMQALARFRATFAVPRNLTVNPGQWSKWWNRRLREVAESVLDRETELSDDDLAWMLADPHVRRRPTRELFLGMGDAA